MAQKPRIPLEDTAVGKMKQKIFAMTDTEIEEAAKVLEVPSPGELEKPGTYIQNTIRKDLIENRRKNDIVIIPVGCTENHGMHTASGFDTLLVTRLAEAVRRKQIKDGKPPVNIAWPVNYGVHPPWHQGMYGSVMLSDEAFEQSIMMMAWGLWNDGFRKQIWINNHAQHNELEKAVRRFMNTMQLPGFFLACEWHRAVREFFETKEFGGKLEDRFIHADEAETSLGLELFPEFVKMENAEEGNPLPGFKYLPDGHFDKSVEDLIRPNTYKTAAGHAPLELVAQPEAVVGKPALAEAGKTLRAVVAFCEYLDLLCDDVLNTWPVGTVPDPESITFRTNKEMEPYLKEPGSEGWKSAYVLPKIGPYTF
ncbi:MAG: creatininase family protein [Deltaproteobacteria bacterium]|nr:creatininase family protein [Deltaproteobacteria bacterium]